MAKKPTKKPDPIHYPITFSQTVETFSRPTWYVTSEPSCVNFLSIRKYRVTVEVIDEPIEVLRDRVLKLWRTKSRNGHDRERFITACRELDMDWERDFSDTESIDHSPGKNTEWG